MESISVMAIYWWKSKCPIDWTVAMHLEHPLVNCTTEAEQNLAQAIADDLK